MSLRVLLADESTTIKKVLQLALQDFAVEVKAVHSGLDVLEVARAFKPDIVFADVLLQKKNGYEVTAELKSDKALGSTPVVLMWSSFMELDEKAYKKSRADHPLEKPFDVESLRQLIMELVPKTRTQRLAHFLQFSGKIVDPLQEEERRRASGEPPSTKPPEKPTAKKPEAPPSNWNEGNFANMNEFQSEEALDDAPEHVLEDTGEDPQKFAHDETHESPKNAPKKTIDDTTDDAIEIPDSDDNEAFVELNLSGKSKERASAPPPIEEEVHELDLAAQMEEREPWSHQSLAKFQIPQAAPDAHEIHTDDVIELEMPEEDPSDGLAAAEVSSDPDFSPNPPRHQPQPKQATKMATDRMSADTSPAWPISPNAGDEDEVKLELEEEDLRDLDPVGRPHSQPASHAGSDPLTVSPELLESIVRSQSRELIETVVKRLVPELATRIIREELDRLLAEPPVRATTPSPPVKTPPPPNRTRPR